MYDIEKADIIENEEWQERDSPREEFKQNINSKFTSHQVITTNRLQHQVVYDSIIINTERD